MISYITRRLLLLFPTLLGTTLVVFLVMGLSPGGVGGNDLDESGSMKPEEAKAQQEYLNKRFGLDQPLMVQYLRWLGHVSPIGFATNPDGTRGPFKFLKVPDLGYSFSKGRPVVDLVAEALPVTLLLSLIALPITYSVAIITGIYSARKRGGWVDVGSASLFMALWSVPVILAGVLLIGFLSSRNYIYLFPTGGLHGTLADSMSFLPSRGSQGWEAGWLLDTCWHLTLPVVCLTYAGFAFTSRLTRASMLENFASDYARTAKAKGLGPNVILFRHVFRNSLIPLITSSAGILPSLFGGALITESIFSLHGMGLLMLEAVRAHDRELVLDQALAVGGLGLISYLIADLLYVVADPRVSYE